MLYEGSLVSLVYPSSSIGRDNLAYIHAIEWQNSLSNFVLLPEQDN